MSDQKAFIDVIRQVGMVGTDPPLTVRPDPDFPGECVEIYASDDAAREYWGAIRLSMPKAMAAALGAALTAAAGDHAEQ